MLTERELQILNLVKLGKYNKEIASELSIAESTVKNHVQNIKAELGALDRTHMVYLALKMGIIGFD